MDKDLFSKVYITLQTGKAVVLIRILKNSGSTPRNAGSACFIDEDGAISGTIGGGPVEYKATSKAKALFQTKTSWIYDFKLTHAESDREGMICGGEVTCYLEPLFPNNECLMRTFHSINDQLEKGQGAMLLTRIGHGVDPMNNNGRECVYGDQRANVYAAALGEEKEGLGKVDKPVLLKCQADNEYIFVDPIMPLPVVILCGAGHVSACVASLAKMVGFEVVVLDDRQEFANSERFPEAKKICVGPFAEMLAGINITKSAYIVIVTRGHAFDKEVLEIVMDRDAAYIGMIGSIRKRNTLYDALLKKGVSQEKLSGVYSPIGLDIDAQTPEEIAVSIVGELIKIRASGKSKVKPQHLSSCTTLFD